jgi:hypothetical protein
MANVYDSLQAAQPQTGPPPVDPRFKNLAGTLQAPAAPMGAPAAGTAAPAIPAPAPQRAQAPPLQAAQPAPAAAPTAPTGDPFAASGGGVQLPTGQWVPANHPMAQPGGAAGAGGGGAAAAGNPMTDAFRSALTQRLQANPIPTSIEGDPVLAAQSGAMRQASARQAARERSTGMEAAAANGLPGDAMARRVASDRVFREGQSDAKLLGDARSERMGELFQALGLAGNYDMGERNLAETTAGRLAGQDIQRAGLSAQTALGQGDLSLRERLGTRGQDLELMSLLLSDRDRGVGRGLQAAGLTSGLNTQALIAAMGGG